MVIRARDEAAGIGRCLELVRTQRTYGERIELILVDSGSRDGTVQIARGFGAHLVQIAPHEFTFGGALNLGAAQAGGQIIVALSAHAFLPDPGWLERVAEAFADERVACASGDRHRPDGSPLRGAVDQDASLARSHPDWGYSNAAGAFRAELWRRRPFRAALPGCEDKEWAWHWLQLGWVCRLDRSLAVEHDHTHDPVLSIYQRARREAEGLAMTLPLGPWRAGGLMREWWSDTRFYGSAARARLSHRRAARLLGARAGRRRGLRRRL